MHQEPLLNRIKIGQINFADPFFDSLRADYAGFDNWLRKKAEESAYVLYQNGFLVAFLYLKVEVGAVTDVQPSLIPAKYLKVGTMKIEAHGTKLGELFIKKIFDNAIAFEVDRIYVTVFEKHAPLISLLQKYGFVHRAMKGNELVLERQLWVDGVGGLLAYPRLLLGNNRQYLLSILPEFHTRLLPDSILNNEPVNLVEDVSYSNRIHKMYISFSRDSAELRTGDALVLYRTGDNQGPAFYRAVGTSIGMVEEVRLKHSFINEQDFINYCASSSVFTEAELCGFYRNKVFFAVIKFTYNAALRRKITRGVLMNEVGVPNDRWVIRPITPEQLRHISHLGGLNENLVVY
ncbi:hypothetical protein ACVBKF_02360 [Shewanella sp. 0m-11]